MIKRAYFRAACKNWYPDAAQKVKFTDAAYEAAEQIWVEFQTEIGSEETRRELYSKLVSIYR
jgi:hypothetical protein